MFYDIKAKSGFCQVIFFFPPKDPLSTSLPGAPGSPYPGMLWYHNQVVLDHRDRYIKLEGMRCHGVPKLWIFGIHPGGRLLPWRNSVRPWSWDRNVVRAGGRYIVLR